MKPREFWIFKEWINQDSDGDWAAVENKKELNYPKLAIHVIEYSAYKALIKKLKKKGKK